MKYILVTVSRGIIEQVQFHDDPRKAILALSEYVRTMNTEYDDAALYDSKGMVANAKYFLDENEAYRENKPLIEEVSREAQKAVFIIGNPEHRLGFMVASPDDPLGYDNPVEALENLGQMRKDHGRHLKLYQVEPVDGPIADRADIEKLHADCDVDDFDYSLVKEYLL